MVLEPAGAEISSDRVALILTPAVPGAPGGHPELGYTVVVCGSRPFHGDLLIGGDAQLSGLHVPGPLASDVTQTALSSTPDLVIGDEGTGRVLDLGAAQVVTLNLATIEPCVTSVPVRRGLRQCDPARWQRRRGHPTSLDFRMVVGSPAKRSVAAAWQFSRLQRQ